MGNNNKAENLEGLEEIRLNRAIIGKQISDIDRKLRQIKDIGEELNDYAKIAQKANAEIEKVDQKEIETGIKDGDDKNTVNGKLFMAHVGSMAERDKKVKEWEVKLKEQEAAIKKEINEVVIVLDLKVDVNKMSDEEINQLLQTILQKKDDLEFERLSLSANTPTATDDDYENAKHAFDEKEIKKIREELKRLKTIKESLVLTNLKASTRKQYEEEKLVLEAKLGSNQMLVAIQNSNDAALLALYQAVFTLSKAETTESGEVQEFINQFDNVESSLIGSLISLYSKHTTALGKFKELQEAYYIGKATFEKQAKKLDEALDAAKLKAEASDKMLLTILNTTITVIGTAALGPAFKIVKNSLSSLTENVVVNLGTNIVKANLSEKKTTDVAIDKTVLTNAATAFEGKLHSVVGDLAKQMEEPIQMVGGIKTALTEVMEAQKWEKLNMEDLKANLETLKQGVETIANAIKEMNLSPEISVSKDILAKHAEKDFWAVWFANKGKDSNPMPKKSNVFTLNEKEEADYRKGKIVEAYSYLNAFIKTEIDSKKALGEEFKYRYYNIWDWFVDWANAYEAGFYWKDVLKSKK